MSAVPLIQFWVFDHEEDSRLLSVVIDQLPRKAAEVVGTALYPIEALSTA